MQISFITVNKPQTKIILKSAPEDASNFNLTVQSTDYTGLKISADGVNYTDATAAPFVSTTGFIYLETKERLSHGSVTLTSANLQEAIWDPDVKFNNISFNGCTKLTKVPTFLWNACTSLASMFNECSLFNQDISTWDTSKVTTLDSMFNGAVTFNQPLNNWDVSKVTDSLLFDVGATAWQAVNKPRFV